MVDRITEDRLSGLLYAQIPEFRMYTERELAADDRKLGYVLAGAFADFLLSEHRSGSTDVLVEAVKFIEMLYERGDDSVQELATVGYLESIQSLWRSQSENADGFAAHLLPESKKWWDELDRFWRGEVTYVGESFSQKS